MQQELAKSREKCRVLHVVDKEEFCTSASAKVAVIGFVGHAWMIVFSMLRSVVTVVQSSGTSRFAGPALTIAVTASRVTRREAIYIGRYMMLERDSP